MTNKTDSLVARLNEHMGRTVFSTEIGKCGFEESSLPFYPDAKMLKATTFTTRPVITRKFIFNENDIITLDGTEDSIEEVNAVFAPVINDETVVAYLKFFFDSVAVPGGRLALIENVDDLKLTQDASDELKSALQKLIAAPVITKDGNAFFVKTFVLFDTTLYHAEMTVLAKGEVEMTDQETAYENLPVERKVYLR